jgi:hypothetical protein
MPVDDEPSSGAEPEVRYPRAWASRQGFAGWKIVVILATLLGVPATLWLLYTVYALIVR